MGQIISPSPLGVDLHKKKKNQFHTFIFEAKTVAKGQKVEEGCLLFQDTGSKSI